MSKLEYVIKKIENKKSDLYSHKEKKELLRKMRKEIFDECYKIGAESKEPFWTALYSCFKKANEIENKYDL